MSEQSDQLKARTRRFALDVLELIKLLPRDEPGPTWLDLIAEGKLIQSDLLAQLQKEGHELEAIFSSSAGTARRNQRSRRTSNPN